MPVEPTDRPRLGRRIRTALSFALLGVVAVLGIATVVVPLATGSTPLTVLTSSMEPSLPPGTLVVVRPTPADRIAVGDVITYQPVPGEPALVTHRVIEVQALSTGQTRFLTQGDANEAPDAAPVTEEQVKGVIWYSVPWVGHLSVALGGDVRAWLLPIVGIGLLGYAAALLGSAVITRVSKSRQAEPALTD